VLRPVATSTASRSSIFGLTTKILTSTLYDIIYYFRRYAGIILITFYLATKKIDKLARRIHHSSPSKYVLIVWFHVEEQFLNGLMSP
jgi:cytochrome c biogenesis protein CcdA